MAKGVKLLLVFFIAVIGLVVAPAVLAESGEASVPTAEKPRAVAAKEQVTAKQAVIQEKVQAIKEAVQTRVQDKKETLRTAAEERKENVLEKAQEKRENAREAAQEKREAIRTKVADSDSRKVEALGRARLKEIAELAPEEAKARLAKFKVVKADEDFKVRPIAAEKLQERKAAFEKLKGEESKIKTDYTERLARVKEAKEKLKDCGRDNETQSEECAKARTNAIERSKEAALKAVERIVTHLQKLKEKIESSENMPEDEVKAKAAKIGAVLAETEATKQKISAATTKKELNEAIRELKQLVKKIKRASEAHSQGLLSAEIHGVIKRSEVMEKKLDCALNGLDAKGANATDTAAVDAKIAEFSSKMAAAKEKLRTAKELLETEEETKIEEGKKLIREARDIVREAHKLLEAIRQDLRKLGAEPCKGEQEIVVDDKEEKATAQPPAVNETQATESPANASAAA